LKNTSKGKIEGSILLEFSFYFWVSKSILAEKILMGDLKYMKQFSKEYVKKDTLLIRPQDALSTDDLTMTIRQIVDLPTASSLSVSLPNHCLPNLIQPTPSLTCRVREWECEFY